MGRSNMIAEVDARFLEYGSTVVLVADGHVTPLGHDTLRERCIKIRRDCRVVPVAGGGGGDSTRVPPALRSIQARGSPVAGFVRVGI